MPPQLATQTTAAPDGDEWLHEIKFEGCRTLARLADREVRLLTRNGHDWTDRYGDLGKAFRVLNRRRRGAGGRAGATAPTPHHR